MARQPGQGVPDYNRMMTRVEDGFAAITDRLEALTDNIDKRLSRVERDLAAGEQKDAAMVNEFAAFRDDSGELRDLVNELRKQVEAKTTEPVAAAAKGAAEGAARVAAVTVAKASFFATWKGWAVAFAAGVAGLGATIDNAPRIVRFFSGLWGFLGGLDK